jgi:hypothetical protein
MLMRIKDGDLTTFVQSLLLVLGFGKSSYGTRTAHAALRKDLRLRNDHSDGLTVINNFIHRQEHLRLLLA